MVLRILSRCGNALSTSKEVLGALKRDGSFVYRELGGSNWGGDNKE